MMMKMLQRVCVVSNSSSKNRFCHEKVEGERGREGWTVRGRVGERKRERKEDKKRKESVS